MQLFEALVLAENDQKRSLWYNFCSSPKHSRLKTGHGELVSLKPLVLELPAEFQELGLFFVAMQLPSW